jgi:hypothetical protein
VEILNVLTADGLVIDDTFVLELKLADFDGSSDEMGISVTETNIKPTMHRGVHHGAHSLVGLSIRSVLSSLLFSVLVSSLHFFRVGSGRILSSQLKRVMTIIEAFIINTMLTISISML